MPSRWRRASQARIRASSGSLRQSVSRTDMFPSLNNERSTMKYYRPWLTMGAHFYAHSSFQLERSLDSRILVLDLQHPFEATGGRISSADTLQFAAQVRKSRRAEEGAARFQFVGRLL